MPAKKLGKILLTFFMTFALIFQCSIMLPHVQANTVTSITIHFQKPSSWGTPNIYYYASGKTGPSWPGVTMTSEGNGWYSYTISNWSNANVIFNSGSNQIPGSGQPGYAVSQETWFHSDGTSTTTNPIVTIPTNPSDNTTTNLTVHFQNVSGWGTPNIYYYATGKAGPTWPGNVMTNDGNGWYSYTISNWSNANVIFNSGSSQIPGSGQSGYAVSQETWFYSNGTSTTTNPVTPVDPNANITVYLKNISGWGTPNIYYYATGKTGPTWPGNTMTSVGDGWYKYTISGWSTANVIFNSGSSQTPASGQPGFTVNTGSSWYSDGKWSTTDPRIDTNAPTLQVDIPSGTYSGTKNLNLSAQDDKDSSPKIYYTTDGTTPTTASTLYTSSISLAIGNTVVKAIAVDNSGNKSDVYSFNYTVTAATGLNTVIIHYNRDSSDYTDWQLHLWNDSYSKDVSFDTDDPGYGKKAIISLDGKSSYLNFLVKKGNWEDRDITETRTVTGNGTMEIWLRQNDPEIHYTQPKIGARIRTAIADEDGIKVYVTKDNGAYSSFKLIDAGIDGKGTTQITGITSTKRTDTANSAMVKLPTGVTLNPTHIYYVKSDSYLGDDGRSKVIFRGYLLNSSYNYSGSDLGVTYSASASTFKLWTPTASSVKLVMYTDQDAAKTSGTEYTMTKGTGSVWACTVPGDQKNKFYLYKVTNYGQTKYAIDPYSRSLAHDGIKSAVINLTSTNPSGWADTAKPPFVNAEDAVIYEIHVRDFSSDPNSGMVNKGKYLAFTEENTKSVDGLVNTGIAHLKELGVTHVHLLPVNDYASVQESPATNDFNWGYDPLNYTTPDGSYSTNPRDPNVRVNEFKQMVQSLHKNGIRVILDVVFNHTSNTDIFNDIVPGYYYRTNDAGYSMDQSGCGNAIASERPMVRKFIVDALKYWATEYKVDGFRFDLAGVLDTDTLKQASAAIHAIDSSAVMYGEPWSADGSGWSKGAMDGSKFAVFNDSFRSALKGGGDDATTGYINSEGSNKVNIMNGIAGSQVVGGGFGTSADDTLNYIDAHDNLILWDKLALSNASDSVSDRKKMQELAYSILLTSQGVPFITSGDEMLRDKAGDRNSYNKPDSENQIKWDNLFTYADVNSYFEGLIALRKAHSAFRMVNYSDINSHIQWLNTSDNVIGYELKDNANGDKWKDIIVIYNPYKTSRWVQIPSNNWTIVGDDDEVGVTPVKTGVQTASGGWVEVKPLSTEIMYDVATP